MWFARRYDEYKASERKWRAGEYDRVKTGNTAGRGHSDPTAAEGLRLASNPYTWKIAAINHAAIAADAALSPYILKNVTADMRYENMPVPCGRNQFFAARRRFFEQLHNYLLEVGY
jgi:hypothetical protein